MIEKELEKLVDDLAYAVLASFDSFAEHQFSVYIDEEEYPISEFGDHLVPMSLCDLPRESLENISIMYDYCDDFTFNLTFVGCTETELMPTLNDLLVLDSKGTGIWEDEHHLMELYYNDPQQFEVTLKENDLTLEDLDIVLENDVHEIEFLNDNIAGDFMEIKGSYEDLDYWSDLEDSIPF